jgi:hypothetical protein
MSEQERPTSAPHEPVEAEGPIIDEQSRQWAALTDAMSVEFGDEPESVPGRNVGECAIALLRRLRAEVAALREPPRGPAVTPETPVGLERPCWPSGAP